MNTLAFPSVTVLTLTALSEEARREIACFQRRQATTSPCSYEVFRRAIVLRDEGAWAALYELYAPVVRAWLLLSVTRLTDADLDALLNEAFARFARALSAQQWREFASVGALLSYLKHCAYSAAADYRRRGYAHWQEEPLDALPVAAEPVSADCAEIVGEQLAAQELWTVICRLAPSVAEQLVLRLVCAQGLPPRAVQQRYPALFPDVQEVYRIKRSVLERLQRHRGMRQFRPRRTREVRP